MTDGGLDPELRAALGQIARVPQLLVGCDYDGTLAPLVDDPSAAGPLPEAVAAVRALAALPQTVVAVISGRALRDLATLSRLPSEVHLVGSHGSEFDLGFIQRLAPELHELHGRLLAELQAISRDHPGIRLETKPASIAVHVRGVDPAISEPALEAVRSGPGSWPDIYVTNGKDVVELSLLATDKGAAVTALRVQASASAVLYLGDDITDENAFAQLHGPDVGVKIGVGETLAGYRVDEPIDAVRVLGYLLEMRRHWLYGDHAVPIERHSMLSNGSTVALLAPDARVTWLCHPRPDSAAIFADILGGSRAGYFSVTPERQGLPLGQRYRPGTMTVETRWSGVTVTDWLEGAVPNGDVPAADQAAPGCSTLVRVLSGSGVARLEFAPRPEFGQVPIRLQPLGDGLLVLGYNEPITLFAPGVEWDVFEDGGHDTARAVVDLSAAGGHVPLELRFDSHNVGPHPDSIEDRQARAEQPSLDWVAGLQLPELARKDVVRSALTLRGLVHEPTGSILAAATMSLPEELGGVRNWDYRYCWLRDAAMSARVLVDLGSLGEAEALLHWVDGCVDRTGGHPERLHPLYTVEGLELGPEAVIDTLPGYAGSRPVRIGNAANRQIQLDVFGPDRRPRGRRLGRQRIGAGRALARRRGDGAGRRAALARARPRALGGPPAATPPRLLQGHVLAHRRSRARGAVAPGRDRAARLDRAARVHSRERARARLERGGRCLLRRVRRRGHRRLVALDRALGAPRRRRSPVPRHRAEDRGRAAQRRGRLPLPVGRRPARHGGRIPHLHRVADRGVPPHRPAWRRRGAVPPDAGDGGPDRVAAGAVRPVRRAWARQPPAGLQPSRADPLRGGAVGGGRVAS